MRVLKALTSTMLALSLIFVCPVNASNDPVTVDPNTGANFNRYAYANNNPYKFTDPDGRDGVAFYTDPQYKMSGSSVDSPEAANTGMAMGAAVYGGVIAVEAGAAALANPATANAIATTVMEASAGEALGGATLAAGATAVAGKISGYTKHGLNQAISRDGGKGVSPKAILSAVKNPTKVAEQAGGKTAYTGKDAKVVLNSDGKVITAIPNNTEALRDPKK